MPTSRRTRKRSTRAEEAAEQAAAEAAAAAAPDVDLIVEAKSEKKTKKTKESKKRDKPVETLPEPPTKEELEAAALATILPQSISEDPSSILCHLLVEIQSLANSKKRCTEALNALKDGRGVATPYSEEDEDDDGGIDKQEESAKAAGKGKKRTRSTDKKKKKGEVGAVSFDLNDGYAIIAENAMKIRDVHLIMAATQAINVLIAYLKSHKGGDEAGNEDTNKHTALILAALSHHLMTSLVNDKSLLESITKSSQYSSSHSSSMLSSFGAVASLSSTWGSIREEDAAMEGNEAPTLARERKNETEISDAMHQKLERKRKRTVAYAKAVAGRAMTSCVVGAIHAMETLGGMKFQERGAKLNEGDDINVNEKAEYNLLRRGVWTCLLALETSFQLNNRPKLLMTSSTSVSSLESSSGMSYSHGVDFDGMMSVAMGSSSEGVATNPTTWMHTHTMMGGNTVAMWNGLVQRIMIDYKLGFHMQHDGLNHDLEKENLLLTNMCHEVASNVFSDEEDCKFVSVVLQQNFDGDSLSLPGGGPPAKKIKKGSKSKKARKSVSTDHDLSELSALLALRIENHIFFDCHVSVRRWSSLAFGWLCCGQTRFLETCMDMLTRKTSWMEIMEMAPIESNSAIIRDIPKTKKNKKKKESKAKITSLSPVDTVSSSNECYQGIRGDLALVLFVSCMVDLISSGGSSPSNSGWIDDYVKAITDNQNTVDPSIQSHSASSQQADPADEHSKRRSTRTSSKASSAKSNKRTAVVEPQRSLKGCKKSIRGSDARSNISDETAFLTKLLIEAHCESLNASFRDHLLELESSSTLANVDFGARKLLVNDDDSYRDSMSNRRHNSEEPVNSIPFYPFIHRTLETLGRSAASTLFVPSSGVKSRIQAIGGAIALSQFIARYRRAEDGDGVVVLDAKLISLAVSQLSDSLKGLVKQNNPTGENSVNDGECNDTALNDFSSMYSLNTPLSIERLERKVLDADSRAIDSAISFGGAFSPSNANQQSAVCTEILSCYIRAHVQHTPSNTAHILGMQSFLGSLLHIIRMCYDFPSEEQNTSDVKTKKKKRKTSSESCSLLSLHQAPTKTMTRCVLAADALNFLRLCFVKTRSASLTMEAKCMKAFLRKVEILTTKWIREFVDLGYVLQDKLIYPRLNRFSDRASFTPEERRLWSSHIKLSLTLGRGQAACAPSAGSETPSSLLQDSEQRLELFQHIANLEQQRQHVQVRTSEFYWPLFLPALQHALVSSNLSSMPTLTRSTSQSELFLCDAFLNSLEYACTEKKARSATTKDLLNLAFVADDVPISLRDARLFTLATTQLKKEDQKAVFSRLVGLLQSLSKEAGLCDVHEIRLLARGVCLASHLADVITTNGLGEILSREVSSAHYGMPKFVNKEASLEKERACCNKETVFMGIFDDCNYPSVPATGVSRSKMLSDSELKKMTELVKSSLELGFKVSTIDGGHLLFSAWNTSAKLCSWTSATWEGPSIATANKKQAAWDVLGGLMSLRDDMCEIRQLFNRDESMCNQSLLERTMADKTNRLRPSEALVSSITASIEEIKHVASKLASEEDIPTHSMFAYCEALPSYLSFLISMHTKPGPNDFSSIHRFSKSSPKKNKPFSYTDEDVLDQFPSDDSDFESTGSQKARALGRLHNACVSLGAAPCWPDWLDTNCRMQADVAPFTATDSAENALLSLVELGVAVQKRYFCALEDALDIVCHSSPEESPPVSAHLLHLLLASQQARSSSGYDSLHSYLSILSQTNAATLKSTVSDRDSLPSNKFASRSVQRVRGADSTVIKDPNIAELRANGQWEMILSEAIRGSSLQNSSTTADKPALKRALEIVSHWKRVLCNVVSAMVPTAALLRFGLHDAKGRRPHPLCNDLPESALSSETITATPSCSSTRNKVGLTIKKAISLLSRSCAFAGPDSPLAQTSQAAANHLLESVASFNDMVVSQSIQIQLNAIEGLFNMINERSLTKSALGAAFNVLKITLDRVSRTQNSSALFASFGLEGIIKARLISESCKVELISILCIEPSCNPFTTRPPEFVKLLLVLLSGKEDSPESLRLMIAQTLCRLIDEEDEILKGKNVSSAGPLRIAAATALIGMTKAELQLLMSNTFYAPTISSTYYKHEIARCSIKLLISLVTTLHENISAEGCAIILDDMTENIMQWAPSESISDHRSLTSLVCILASRFGTLPGLINRVLSLATAGRSTPDLTECIQCIFQFVVELQQVAGQGLTEPPVQASKERNMSNTRVQRTCTFTQTGEGFAEQHWYNCYTCGLLWDKGCCSLCARVCHQDHDVGYSRKSSFFCDCGAEVTSGARQKCKCLSPISDSIFNALNECTPTHREHEPEDAGNQARLVYRCYPTECSNTLKLLTEDAKASQWNEAILGLFNQSFKMNDHVDFSALYKHDSPVIPTSDNGKPGLDHRCGVPLDLKLLGTGQSMLPVRAAKSNSIKIGVLSSSSSIHMRRHRTGRYLMEADMRGRLICAESNSLSFFNAIPSIHTRCVETPYSSHLSRSQLSCLGTTEKINFDVQGLRLSGNQNLLVVWGSSKACVMVLSRGCCAIEKTISLAFQFEPDSSECESEFLIRCLWLTDAIVVVVCGTVVHLFDLATTDRDNSCKAVAHFALAYEDVLICSAVLTSDLSVSTSKDVHKKLVILLDSGRIHFIDLFVGSDGVLEEEGETYIEIGTGTSFPSAGIRRYFGGEPSSAGSTSTTLGEGTSLHFLQQSNLLLYQCVSSPVVAMLIDKNGAISGTFELLPSTISSDNLQGSDLGVVTGPYLHFQELGTVYRDGVIFYRVSCVARVPSSNQQKILLLEFNQTSSVSVKELLWPPSFSAGLGSFSSNNYVGSCTLSIPHLIGGLSSQGYIDAQTEIFERVFLSMLSSNGSILWFGEDCNGLAKNQTGQSKSKPNTNNIYMFEDSSILNVSEKEFLVFSGEYAGKDSKTLKKKLSLNNSEFLSSPSRDGCTLTARLECSSTSDKAATDLAIVAVRVLVGSMPDLIPREMVIMGKVIKTKRNMKRWYDYVFTDEEILLAIRSGLVTINFSSSHDLTSGAVIDCVEVYAKKRSNLDFLNLESKYTPRNVVKWQNTNKQAEKDQISCIKSLTSIARFSRDPASHLLTSVREAIKQILEKTALDSLEEEKQVVGSLRSSALSFLKQVEEDTVFIHDSTLKGLITMLMDMGHFIKSEVSVVGVSKVLTMLSNALDTMIHIMRIGSDIARVSAENYKAAMISITDGLTSEDAATGDNCLSGREKRSLAIEAKKILDYAAHLALLYGSTVKFSHATYYLSDLILIEILACGGEFAQFDTLSEYLMHEDSCIVESCCKAIISIYTDLPKLKSAEDKSHDNPDGYVTYQCDACKAFPIKDIRYTIEGEVDIDLCKECFEKGCTYASSNSGPLIIHGRTLCVEDEDMQCESIWQMKGIVISAPSAGFPMVEDVEAALKMSQTNKKQASSNGSSVDKETFKSQIFTNLLSLISKSMAKASIPPPHLINLVLGIVQGSKSERLRIARGKELLKHTTDSLSGLLQTNATGKIVFLLRVLSSLITKKTSIELCPADLSATECSLKDIKGHLHKSKTDPRFICDVHRVPAVRRRCSHGVHKNRRFYVCGLERKHRCTYFRWADDLTLSDSPVTQQNDELHSTPDTDGNHPAIFEPIQIELNQILDDDSVQASSIQSQFCNLIRKQFEQLKDSIPEVDGKENASERPTFLLRNEDDINQEINDGIIQSRIRLGKQGSTSTTKCLHASSGFLNDATSLISESLWLFSLVASPQNPGSDSEWHPVLCSIITGGSPVLIHLAKRYLQKLCGGDQDLYHRICDQYVYGYHFRKLLRLSEGVLDFALIVREMAKQCGDNWRNDEIEFNTLSPAGLFGVGDLISEDCLSVSYDGAVQQILDELLTTAGTHARKRNWRNFCFSEVPGDSNEYQSSNYSNVMEQLVRRPPILCILWLSSCLRGSNQVKMLQLADIALPDVRKDVISTSREDDVKPIDALTDESTLSSHEQTLSSLNVGDLHAFVVEFVINGRSKDLRCVAARVATKLACRFCNEDKNDMMGRFVDGLLCTVSGKFGRACKEFVELLEQFVLNFNLDLSNIATRVTSALHLQLTAANHCIPKQSSSNVRFDLANCVHCHNKSNTNKSSSDTSSKENETWIDDQLRPCVKSRLESSTLASVHSEYSSFYQLKFRVVLSEIQLTVSDPRGRLVKNVGVYFSPRPVADVSMLKNDKYNHWQRCGTLSLARHATTATLKLKVPVVAANLKIKYEDFYNDKTGGSTRASDGTFVLMCPRCTRQVNNAHGVCGNCGEVAFQCRKCRHINYDRLDAFLCVECGYCTSGGFSYDATVGMALNAVAVIDEDGYQRSVSMLRIANKRHVELRNNLKKKLLAYSFQQGKINGQDEQIEEMAHYGPHLRRAFLGKLPKMNDESESKVSSSNLSTSRQVVSNHSLTSSRARSLLSLARQLRNDSAGLVGDSDRISRSDLLQQALLSAGGGSEVSSDILDEINETVFGSADHSLTRAVASLNDRNQQRTTTGEESARAGTKEDKKSAAPGESSRIYSQMREAERECYELTRRIEAWNRLNEDALATTGAKILFRSTFAFQPTSCSKCSPHNAMALMKLLSSIYSTSISQSEETVTPELIKLLITELHSMNTELKNIKRKSLITLASNSEYATKFILEEIKLRLTAVQDITSAELLGQIIQLDFPSVGDYIDLAVTVLQGK